SLLAVAVRPPSRLSTTLIFDFQSPGAGLRLILRILTWTFTVLLLVAAVISWYFVYRPLPQIDGTLTLPGLHQPVTVERDNWGIPRIRASSLEDAAEAQGYVMAQDRLFQLDLLRRVSSGRLAEIV